jgi:hypothetical protein
MYIKFIGQKCDFLLLFCIVSFFFLGRPNLRKNFADKTGAQDICQYETPANHVSSAQIMRPKDLSAVPAVLVLCRIKGTHNNSILKISCLGLTR